jgi:hypothetical protein
MLLPRERMRWTLALLLLAPSLAATASTTGGIASHVLTGGDADAAALTGGDAAAALDTCSCAFDLVMSCFVTEQRGSGPAGEPDTALYRERHRYSRYDVLVLALRTYAALPLKKVPFFTSLHCFLSNQQQQQQILPYQVVFE